MLKENLSKLKQLFNKRKFSYCQVFKKNDQAAQFVLEDLAKFCRATDTTFHQDPRMHAILEGRREVWIRIQNHLNLNIEELYELHHVRRSLEQK